MAEIRLDIDAQAVEEAENMVQKFLEEVAIELSNELKMEAPVSSGQLRQSITIVNRRQGTITVGIQAKYAMAIQNGTRAFTPPLEPLKTWGRRKLGSEEIGAAVWGKIRQEGIDENPFVTRAMENLRAKY